MQSAIKRLREQLSNLVWGDDLRAVRGMRRFLIRVLRFVYALVRDLLSGELNLRAMSLVYTTLLSLVPLLAVSFSVLKGFGVHNQVEPLLLNFLAPLGPKGEQLASQIIQFVENVRVGVLGSLGLALLIYTVVSLLQKIERAFNYVWRVEALRNFSQRLSNYLSVILIGPVMIFTALGITASVMNNQLVQYVTAIEPFGSMFIGLSRLVPYLLVCLAFTFIYAFVPNTRVRFGAAAVGGLVAGVLWQTTGWGFTAFIAGSAKYAAIYSSFAILILFLIWLYLCWLVLLVGAQIAFYVQNPQYLSQTRVRLMLSNRLKERLALVVMYLVAGNHCHNRPPWTVEALVERLDLPGEPIQNLLNSLVENGYLARIASDPPGYLPARDVDTIRVSELLIGVRQSGESRFLSAARMAPMAPVDGLMQQVEQQVMETLSDTTFGSLVADSAEQNEETATSTRPTLLRS